MNVQLPDGKVAEFPDDMPHEAIAEVIKSSYSNPSREISAITAKAVPTPAESMEMGKSVMRQIPPAIGDVGLSLLLKKPIGRVASMLPETASVVPKLMQKLAGTTMRAGAAGAGSGIGELAAQKTFNEPMDMDAVKNQMVFGASTQLGFDTLNKIAGSTLRYLKNNTSGGQLAVKQIAGKIRDKTTERAEKFVNDLAPESIKSQSNVLDDISLKMKQAELESHAEYDVYKKAMENHYKSVGEIDLQHTFDYLNKIRDEVAERQATGQVIKEGSKAKSDVFGKDRVRKDIAMKKALFPNMSPKSIQGRVIDELLASSRNGEPVTPDAINDLLINVFKKGKNPAWDNLTTLERNRLEGLKDALKADLDYIPVESGGTVKTAKEAADENFKAIKRYNSVLEIYNRSIKEDDIGNIMFKPRKFAKDVFMSEQKFMKDPVLKDLWPTLKAEAEEYARVSDVLTSKEMKPHIGDNWMDNIPGSKLLGKMSAYSLMDPGTQNVIKNILKISGTTTEAGLKFGAKVIGSEAGINSIDQQDYWQRQQ